jgi:flagellar biosynthesis protein FlhB
VKNVFSQEEIDFLKHILSEEGVRLDLKKLQPIKNWKRPIMVKGI